MNFEELIDDQWSFIRPHLPPQPKVGRKRADDGKTINAILYVLITGCRWRDTIEPRKGQMQAFAAFEQLWAKSLDANFVIVGKLGWNVKKLAEPLYNHPERGSRLFWLEGIIDEYLEKSMMLRPASLPPPKARVLDFRSSRQRNTTCQSSHATSQYFARWPGSMFTILAARNRQILQWRYENGLGYTDLARIRNQTILTWLTWKQSAQQLLRVILHEQWYTKWIEQKSN